MRSRQQTIAIILSKYKKSQKPNTTRMSARTRNRKPFTFEHSVTDAYSGQIVGYIIAKDKDGNKLGYVDYARYQNEAPHINMIEVHKEHRKKGVGQALVRALRREFMQKPTFSSTTPDGERLRKKTNSKFRQYDPERGWRTRGKPSPHELGEHGESLNVGEFRRRTSRMAL
jgi:GNAT superfamily N-acetyltransferase